MASPRRRTDSEEEDYRSERRGGPLNGHTKWVVGAVGTLIITALVSLAARDRMSIDREQMTQGSRISVLERAVTELATTAAANQASNGAFRDEVLRSLNELKADVKEVKREVRR